MREWVYHQTNTFVVKMAKTNQLEGHYCGSSPTRVFDYFQYASMELGRTLAEHMERHQIPQTVNHHTGVLLLYFTWPNLS